MKWTKTTTAAVLILSACMAWAPSVRAMDWDHVHLMATDSKAGAEWYAKHFGGKVTKSGPFDAVLFGDDILKLTQRDEVPVGSAGSVIDHIGFSVPDVQAKLDELERAGAKVVSKPRHIESAGFTFAFLEDPWGTKIELIDDKDVPGFHHVHLMSPDPKATAEWYANVYGGEVVPFKGLTVLSSILYGDTWVIVQQARGDVVASVGTSVDHHGFHMSPEEFDAVVKNLKGMNTEFQLEPRQSGDHRMAFITGPQGAKIELIEVPGN